MFSNYVKVAIRNIARNKLYAVINIIGLAMGLSIYLFGGLLSDYEYSHDTFFKNSERIYTVRGVFNTDVNAGVKQIDSVPAAVAPVIKAELTEIEAVARTVSNSFLVSVNKDNYYETIRFADPELLQILDFEFIYGDASSLDGSTGALITETIAQKYFGTENPIGKSISLNHEHDLSVSAVVKDMPINSHFNSNIQFDNPLGIVIPISAMQRIRGYTADENWGTLSIGDLTYILLPSNLDQQWLQTQIEGIYERHFPEKSKDLLSSIFVSPLTEANTAYWDAVGIPVIFVIEVLGILVLIIASVNYTNLATAQSMGRSREVGLRKTMGAGPIQLLSQFIVESMTITLLAMILALTVLEIIVPLFNTSTGKILSIEYLNILPWLVATTLIVGIFSGAYPAYLITQTNPIEALRDKARKGLGATWIRGLMIGAQFAISVFMLALVTVVYMQNKQVEDGSNIFSKDMIYTLDRLNIDQITGRHETLRNEILNIDGVENFSYSSQIPFVDYHNVFFAAKTLNDMSSGFRINQMVADHEFLNTYEIPLVAGRQTSIDISMDTHIRERGAVNVMVNELAAKNFGYSTADEAVGKTFYEDEGERGITTYTIVGVIKDQNIYGLQNSILPFVFFTRAASYRHASLKISESATPQTIRDIEEAWNRVVPDYPLQARFLDSRFQDMYGLFDLSTKSLASFAMFALFLALIGLFGLAAFMAEQRTKEIGIRKVLGANTIQIVKLLIWQFSKPVLWATPVALVFAYFASNVYLEFFSDRINMPYVTLIGAGIIGLLLSWATVATHAYKVARTNPINALHYE